LKTITYLEIATDVHRRGAIERNDHPGFKEDYLVLHCLIKKYKPASFMEIGTSIGRGTNVICNAMGLKKFFLWRSNKRAKVYSLDVPPGTDPMILYPESEDGHPDRAGMYCRFPYVQLYGNSVHFDFCGYYPLEGWFIDGKHDYYHVKSDTEKALAAQPKIIIWHDADMLPVKEAAIDVLSRHRDYELFFVEGTRIAFAPSIVNVAS
jgi:hypothetical protein